jgi:NTE family protein
MFAVVLSGGGNHGALQAGALEVFMEAGLEPDIWIGTSAGGINAIMMASNPSADGARSLQEQWKHARPIPSSYSGLFTIAQQFIRGKNGFFPTEPVAEFVRQYLPFGVETFGELFRRTGHRALTISVEYPTGIPKIFGESPDDLLINGMMASSAFPVFFPPWACEDAAYVDGGIYANLPVRVAVEYGASVLLALEVRGSLSMVQGSGIVDVAAFSLSTMIKQQTLRQLEWARREGARIYHLVLDAGSIMGWDFQQGQLLVEMGRSAARNFLLQSGSKFDRRSSMRWRIRRLLRRGPDIKPIWKPTQ